jgi:GntR family transcriptional regulator
MVVMRDSGVPPYRQVADVLRMRIESGDLGPRRRLPSIAELVEEHGPPLTPALSSVLR